MRVNAETDGDAEYENYYFYDDYGQLTREDNGHVGYTFLYTYDNSGNITKVQKYNYSESATPSGTPTENTFTYDTTHTDRLTKFNNKSITYDNNGCVKTYDGWTYTWNKGKLSSIQKGGTVSARAVVLGNIRKYTFSYNGYGQRIEKKYTYMPGLNAEREYLASSTASYTYDLSGRLLSDTRQLRYNDGTIITKSFVFLYEGSEIVGVIFTNSSGTGTYYYDKNPLGDVIGILDNSGNTVVKYKYDAYGNCTRGASSNYDLADNNPIRYRSYYFDEDTGLYYLNARYYNPEWRRFISPDDTAYLDIESANGLNLYAYCRNDPVNYADPSGHFAISLTFLIGSILTGAAIGAGISGVVAYAEGERGWDLFWDIVGGGILGAAIGATTALGGAAGLAATGAKIAVGASTKVLNVSIGIALGVSIGGTAFASATKYSLDCAANDKQWNIGIYLLEAVQGALQGASTFGLAYLGGKAGLFNQIGDFKGWYDFYIGYGGMNNLKMISYMSNLIIGPTLSKMILISGVGAGIRWLIDKSIPEF